MNEVAMKTITVTVNPNSQLRANKSREISDPRLAFWDNVATQSREKQDYEWSLTTFANEREQRLKNQLPRLLHSEITGALASGRGDRGFHNGEFISPKVSPGRLILTVESIHYGSMKVDVGIPDVDAFIEVLGNNSEAFEALFGAYFPEALNRILPGDAHAYGYDVSIPTDVKRYIDSARDGKPAKSENSAKEKGTALLVNLIQSPLILPIILICFLWYYARQDMIEERHVTYGLIQTLITEQTAVISLLKDKETTAPAEGKSGGNAAIQSAAKPAGKSATKEEGK